MAQTSVGSSDSNAVLQYSPVIFKAGLENTVLNSLSGSSENSIVQVKSDLAGNRSGYGVQFPFYSNLSDESLDISSQANILGKEDQLNIYTDTVNLNPRAVAVALDTFYSAKINQFDLVKAHKDALSVKLQRALDKHFFDKLKEDRDLIIYKASGTLSDTRTAATADGAIEATDVLDLDLITSLQIKMSTFTGEDGVNPIVRPVMINGMETYCLMVHPHVLYDLKRDSEFVQAQREAIRVAKETDHPLFKGANTLLYDGVVIKADRRVETLSTFGGSNNVEGAKCTLLGAQSMLWAWGAEPILSTEDIEHKTQQSIAYKYMYGAKKPVFNSLTYGSVDVWVARGAASALTA
jgi:N4-gp56 family major capsid protein